MAREFTAGVVLFDEDFDLPPPPQPSLEPEVIEPVFSAVELAAAREEAARDSREEALAEVEVSTKAEARHALSLIAAQIEAARAEANSLAEQSSEAIARLLLDCFAAALPALSARHGAAEVAAVMRTVLPALRREQTITVRINPHIVEAMTLEIAALDADVAPKVKIIPTDALAVDDVRIAWEGGDAVRDMKSLWSRIENILAPAGLLNNVHSNVGHTQKEHALVD